MSEKAKILEYFDRPQVTNARNSMGCSENWYNSYYSITKTFTKEEIINMSDQEIDCLVKLADNIAENLF